jgi:hypothetical protein
MGRGSFLGFEDNQKQTLGGGGGGEGFLAFFSFFSMYSHHVPMGSSSCS